MEEVADLGREFEGLSVSKRLVRSVSQKIRKKNKTSDIDREDEDSDNGVSVKCLMLYGRGGGCKVGADMGDDCSDSSCRRRSSASEEGKRYRTVSAMEETMFDCFSYGMRERFWKRSSKKLLEVEDSVQNCKMHVFLPDDILEMCLVRLPLTSLMTARLVCKRWRHLTSTPRFLRMRKEGLYQNPWLFVFGTVRDGYCSGEIHAFDVSQDQWHRIDAGFLKGRFMFSVASVQDDIYIVGGCSSLTNSGKVDHSSYKTHRGLLVFSPLNKSWRKAASMQYARSMPILGTYEVSSDFSAAQSNQNRHDWRFSRSRYGVVSDVYEDPHRLSLRRHYRNSYDGGDVSLSYRKTYRFIKQKSGQSYTKGSKKYVLIVVGGIGSRDEVLDSGEMYDSVTNKWTEIQKLPVDFGMACAGVVCDGIFYVYSEHDRLAGYDIERGYWIGIQTSSFPPRVHEYCPQFVCCGSRLFMLCVSWCEGDGQIGHRNKAVRKLWELDFVSHNWTEISVHPDAPMDWISAFVAGRNLIFGIEMFKIFGQVLDFLTVCDVNDMEIKWSHLSSNQMAREVDAYSCLTKSMAVLYL